MNTQRELILQTLQHLLERKIPEAQFYRSRQAALAREEGNGIVLQPKTEVKTPIGFGLVQRDFTFTLTVIARGPVPDQVADPIVLAAHRAIMADRTLTGLVAQTLEEGTDWDFEVADQNAVACEVRYACRYQTPDFDLLDPQFASVLTNEAR